VTISAEIMQTQIGKVCRVHQPACSGCSKAGCSAKTIRFKVDPDAVLGAVALKLSVRDLAAIWANSLGLPLAGLLLSVGCVAALGLHEGWQLSFGLVGFIVTMASCRAYPKTVLKIDQI